jgi:membrane-associated phospholipid phosphatase
MKYLLILSLLFSLAGKPATAQSPYSLTLDTEIPIGGFTALTLAYAYKLSKNHPILTAQQVSSIDTSLLMMLDRKTIHYHNRTADQVSTIMLFLSFSSFAVPAIDPNMRKDYGTYAVINGETVFSGLSIYGSFKNTVNRPRPFMCAPDDPYCDKYVKSSTASFPSGHVTMSACNAFYTAKIINDNSNNTGLKIATWSTAALYPAVVGLLRIKSGKHYPTDVIAGYIIGAAAGILIADVHQIQD